MKLSTRLTLAFLLLSILPLIIVGYLAYSSSRQAIEQATFNYLVSTNTLKENELNRWLQYEARQVRALANRPLAQEAAAVLASTLPADPVFQKAYDHLLNHHLKPVLAEGGFTTLSILHGSTGVLLISTDKTLEGVRQLEEFFFSQGQKETYISKVEFSPSRGQSIMRVSTPIKDQAGRLVGVLVGRVDMREMAQIINLQSGMATTKETYLVNNRQFFVTEPKYGRGYDLKKTVSTEGVEACLERQNGVELYQDYRDIPVVGAYQWLPEQGLCMLTEVNQDEALAPVIALRNTVLGCGCLIALMAAIVSVFYARGITGPLQELVHGVEAIARGNLEVRVKARARDEIGRLAEAFNHMTTNLGQSLAEHKQAEQRIIENLDFTQRVLETAPIGILTYQASGQCVAANETAAAIVGAMPALMLQQNFRRIESWRKSGLLEIAETTLAHGTAQRHEIHMITTFGKEIWLDCRFASFISGNEPHLLLIIDDLTETRVAQAERGKALAAAEATKQAGLVLQEYSHRLEEMVEERTRELRETQEELVRREKLAILGQLAGGVSHELRNPLGAIKNAVYFLNIALEQPEPEVQEIIQILEREADRCNRIVGSLLDFARPRTPVLHPVNLRQSIDKVLSEQAIPAHIKVDVQFEPGLPSLRADADQLHVVFSNLIRNAVQAMGSPPLSADTDSQGCRRLQISGSLRPGGDEVILSFQDTGAGITPEHLNRLFEPLFTTKAKGIGLGLALCKLLVEGHGGRVAVKSEPGRGTTFTVYLPL